jgi:hypothetical protein
MNIEYNIDNEQYRPIEPKRKKPLNITVLVFDKADNMIREYKKEFNNKDHRRWLNTMLYWAISNGYSIEINS